MLPNTSTHIAYLFGLWVKRTVNFFGSGSSLSNKISGTWKNFLVASLQLLSSFNNLKAKLKTSAFATIFQSTISNSKVFLHINTIYQVGLHTNQINLNLKEMAVHTTCTLSQVFCMNLRWQV